MESTIVRGKCYPLRGGISMLMLLLSVLLLNGCQRGSWPPQSPQRSDPVEFINFGPGTSHPYTKHNDTSLSADGWIAEVWTSGEVYDPWEAWILPCD